MGPEEHLLILGASARAAAFSALRAGLRPWCVDLFADADLCQACVAQRLVGKYPAGFEDLLERAPPGPWMYTGGLENHPRLVDRLAGQRRLWGNDGRALRLVRDPAQLAHAARAAGLPTPALAQEPRAGQWLLKPRAGAGGNGIRPWRADDRWPGGRYYLQQFLPGASASALFLAVEGASRLLGITQQLVGEEFLHAPAFGYCGSLGPLPVEPSLAKALSALGASLAGAARLRGLFGVDGILHEGSFWPVEVNPRYTASVEVLEQATGLLALQLHQLAFEDPQTASSLAIPAVARAIQGKAILFARQEVVFPPLDQFGAALRPHLADLPHEGCRILPGAPILTFFAEGADHDECGATLRSRAATLEAGLYAGG